MVSQQLQIKDFTYPIMVGTGEPIVEQEYDLHIEDRKYSGVTPRIQRLLQTVILMNKLQIIIKIGGSFSIIFKLLFYFQFQDWGIWIHSFTLDIMSTYCYIDLQLHPRSHVDILLGLFHHLKTSYPRWKLLVISDLRSTLSSKMEGRIEKVGGYKYMYSQSEEKRISGTRLCTIPSQYLGQDVLFRYIQTCGCPGYPS